MQDQEEAPAIELILPTSKAPATAACALVGSCVLWVAACSTIEPAPGQPEQTASGIPQPARPTASGTNGPEAVNGSETDDDSGPLEVARESARSTAEWLARSVDSWFGDKPFEAGGKVTDGRLSLNVLHRKDTGNDASLRFNARFRLPNIERKTYLYLGRDNFREVVTDKPGVFSRQDRLAAEQAVDRSFFAGLSYDLRDTIDFRLGFRGGLKPYVQVRYRHAWLLNPLDLVEVRETIFWTLDDRLGSTSAASYEHAFAPNLALRWLTAATITQQSRAFDWSSALGLYHALPRLRQWSIDALLSGRKGSGVAISEYGVQVRWQQPVHKDWAIGEMSLGHFWPRPDRQSERGRAWAVGLGLKLRF